MGLFFSFLQIQEKGLVLILNLIAFPQTPDSTLSKKSSTIHRGIFQLPLIFLNALIIFVL